jgi:hypothetical protein
MLIQCNPMLAEVSTLPLLEPGVAPIRKSFSTPMIAATKIGLGTRGGPRQPGDARNCGASLAGEAKATARIREPLILGVEHADMVLWADERFAGGGASVAVRDVHPFDGARLEMTSNA